MAHILADRIFHEATNALRRDALDAQARVIARALFAADALLQRTQTLDFDALPYEHRERYLTDAMSAIAETSAPVRQLARGFALDRTQALVEAETADLFTSGDEAIAETAIAEYRAGLVRAYRHERGRL